MYIELDLAFANGVAPAASSLGHACLPLGFVRVAAD